MKICVIFIIVMGTKTNRTILLAIVALIVLYALYISSFIAGSDNLKPELHLVPNGYRGEVYIIFNQKNGRKREFYNKKWLYKIPASGVLLTNFAPNPGWITNDSIIKIYYSDEANRFIKRIHSMYLRNLNDTTLLDSLVATGIEYHNLSFKDTSLVVCKYTIDTLKLINSSPLSKINLELLGKSIKR